MTDHRNPPRELELKLSVPEGWLDAIARHPVLQAAATRPPRRRHEVTTYFDTPGQVLAARGITCRVRCADGLRVQTVKADRRAGVAADRDEWEWPLLQDEPDLDLLAHTGLSDRLPAALELAPVLTTDIHRTVYELGFDDGSMIEAALDEGVIAAGTASEPVRELELELKAGDLAAVYRLALELQATLPLTVAPESKAARGYRLGNGTRPIAHKAADTVLQPDGSAAVAFGQILHAGLGHLLANQPAVLAGDAEGLHQMRVAIRRLRSAVVLFRPCLEPHGRSRFEAELRRVGKVVGEARDWDVFCAQIPPAVAAGDDVAQWPALLRQPAAARREAAYRRVEQELDGPAFTALVLGLAAWAEQARGGGRVLGGAALDGPIADLCPHLLQPLADKVARRGRHIRNRNEIELHALRKSLKKLRYAINYLAALYPPKAVKRYLRACKKLQRSLGGLNDAVAAIGLAERLTEGPHADLAPAVGVLASRLARRRDTVLRELPKRWRQFRAAPRFWT